MRRADSTISRQSHRKTGSTINEEMLQGLHARDPPRAEGLSEAMQGPLPAPPGDQLAALSQVKSTFPVLASMSHTCSMLGVALPQNCPKTLAAETQEGTVVRL